MNPYEKRIQRLPGPCRLEQTNPDGTTKTVPLHYDGTLFWWFAARTKLCQRVSSPEKAKEMVIKAEEKGIGAFASTNIPVNNNQHGVFAISAFGETEWIWRKYYHEIETAHNSVFGLDGIKTLSGKPAKLIQESPQKDKKDMRLACRVSFPIPNGKYTDKQYTYRCRQNHLKGEKVTVKVEKQDGDFELKNVKVESTFITTERALIALAENLGYEDIAWLYCEEAIEL